MFLYSLLFHCLALLIPNSLRFYLETSFQYTVFFTGGYIFASRSFVFFRSPQLPLTLKIVSLRLMTSHLMPGSLIYVLNLRVFSECPFLCRYYRVILGYFSFLTGSVIPFTSIFPPLPFSHFLSPLLTSPPLLLHFSAPPSLSFFHPLSPLPRRFERNPLKTNKHRRKNR